ncbi:MAG: hypothetical protein IPJ41_10120 [Phycisphaerales bacterium]|nr:hypothetical protein [Phycisphaerales bacterium]
MRAKSTSFGLIVAMAAVTATVQAQQEIRVRVWCGGSYQDSYYDAGGSISIDVTSVGGCPDHINIWDRTANPSHAIGPVYLYGSRSTDITVTISSGAWRGLDDTQHASAGGTWAGITASPGVEDHVLLEGHVGGDLSGLISVGEIYRLDIDGEVQSGVQASTSGLGPFWLYAGSIGTNGNATSTADSITRIETLIGDAAGEISAADGIGSVIVAGDLLGGIDAGDDITNIDVTGDIGTAQSPISIGATGDIRTVTASSIYAAIAASDPGGSGT